MMSDIDNVHPDSGYRLLRLIAQGSRARVYEAEETEPDGRKLAVKFLREDVFPSRGEAVKHLNHEVLCQSLSACQSVVAKINAGLNEEGRPYLVSEYCPGRTLKELFAAATVDTTTIVNLVILLTHAVENMHKIGVLHLDLRPDKIIVETAGKNITAKIIGFGRAKFLPWAGREQAIEPLPKSSLYSLQYVSPEQAMDKRCLPASDVYSLGCILYEALAGRPPVQGENEVYIMAQHLSGKFQPPSLVAGNNALRKYDDVVMQSLACETHKRFVDAAEFRESLSCLLPTGWLSRLFKK